MNPSCRRVLVSARDTRRPLAKRRSASVLKVFKVLTIVRLAPLVQVVVRRRIWRGCMTGELVAGSRGHTSALVVCLLV